MRESPALSKLHSAVTRLESDLLQLRAAAWGQYKAQPQISRLRARKGAERAAASVALSNLHFKASESVVAAHFSVVGPVVRVTIVYSSLTGAAPASAGDIAPIARVGFVSYELDLRQLQGGLCGGYQRGG